MEVRVLTAPPSAMRSEEDYVRVHTCADPLDDTVTLATIERITDCASSRKPQRVKPLVVRQPLPLEVAVGLATRYAERKNIRVVYADTDRSE